MMQERLWNVIASKIGRPGVFEIEFHRKQKTSPELTASMLIPLAIFFSFFLPSIYTHIRYKYIYIYIIGFNASISMVYTLQSMPQYHISFTYQPCRNI